MYSTENNITYSSPVFIKVKDWMDGIPGFSVLPYDIVALKFKDFAKTLSPEEKEELVRENVIKPNMWLTPLGFVMMDRIPDFIE